MSENSTQMHKHGLLAASNPREIEIEGAYKKQPSHEVSLIIPLL